MGTLEESVFSRSYNKDTREAGDEQLQEQLLNRSVFSSQQKSRMNHRIPGEPNDENGRNTPCSSVDYPIPKVIDVVVVGAGPTGLALSILLALQGVPFICVDTSEGSCLQSRALVLHSRTLEIFGDIGVIDDFMEVGTVCRGAQLYVNYDHVAELPLSNVTSYQVALPTFQALASLASGRQSAAEVPSPCSSTSPYAFSLIVSQNVTEKILERRLNQLGHKVNRLTAVWRIEKFGTAEPAHYCSSAPTSPWLSPVQNGTSTAGDQISNGARSPVEKNDDNLFAYNSRLVNSFGLDSSNQQCSVNATTNAAADDTPISSPSVDDYNDDELSSMFPVTVQLTKFGDGAIGSTVAFDHLKCRYVVGCDGARSTVRKAANILFDGDTTPTPFVVADVLLNPDELRGLASEHPSTGRRSIASSPISPPIDTNLSSGTSWQFSRSQSLASAVLADMPNSLISPHQGDFDGQTTRSEHMQTPRMGVVDGMGKSPRMHHERASVQADPEVIRKVCRYLTASVPNHLAMHFTPNGFILCVPMPPISSSMEESNEHPQRGVSNGEEVSSFALGNFESSYAGCQRWRVIFNKTENQPVSGQQTGNSPLGFRGQTSSELQERILRKRDSESISDEEVTELIERRLPGCAVRRVLWAAVYLVGTRLANKFKEGRILLAGDAAHIHPPTLAQGMNLGIQDSFNLAWKMSRVLVYGANSSLLESYAFERRQVCGEVVRLTTQMFDLLFGNAAFPPSRARRCLIRFTAPLVLRFPGFSEYFRDTVSMTAHKYDFPSSILGSGSLGSPMNVQPGSRIPDCLIKISRIPAETAMAASLPYSKGGYLFNLIGRGRHILLLNIHVLPPGSRRINWFGCELASAPLVARYNGTALASLSQLARLSILATAKEPSAVYRCGENDFIGSLKSGYSRFATRKVSKRINAEGSDSSQYATPTEDYLRRRYTKTSPGSTGSAQVEMWTSELRVIWCIHGQPAYLQSAVTSKSITFQIERNGKIPLTEPKARSYFLPVGRSRRSGSQNDCLGRLSSITRGSDEEDVKLVTKPLLRTLPQALLSEVQTTPHSTGDFILFDFLRDMETKMGLKLVDPHAKDGDSKSAAFCLIRPDGHVAVSGYSGDSAASREMLDYLLKY